MFQQVKKVLFASDLTENSRKTFYYAATMGAYYKSGIILIHVVERIPLGIRYRLAGLEGEEGLRKMREAHEQEARRILIGKRESDPRLRKELAEFYTSGRPEDATAPYEIEDILIREGNIAEEIVKAAAETGCGLIVMGAHKVILGSTATGSVTRTVLHNARVPVLVVPPQDVD